jgi:hypothetical protein
MYAVRDPGGLATKLQVFTNYIHQLGYAVLVRNGDWLRPHLDRAFTSGLRAGERWTKTILEEPAAELDFLHAKSELEGVVDAITQQTTRAVSAGLRRNDPSRKIYADIMSVVRKIQKLRLNLLGHNIIVHEHNLGRLFQFKNAGHTRVGIIPEAHVETRDRKNVLDEVVAVQTAGDDKVCPICEDIAAEGPYDIDEAEALIPAHARCRCVFIPAEDEERGELFPSTERLLEQILREFE